MAKDVGRTRGMHALVHSSSLVAHTRDTTRCCNDNYSGMGPTYWIARSACATSAAIRRSNDGHAAVKAHPPACDAAAAGSNGVKGLQYASR